MFLKTNNLIIFDWDGTLMNSTNQIVFCLQAAARDLGWPEPTEAAAQHIIGLSLPLAMQQLFPQAGSADIQALIIAYSRHYLADEGGGAQLFDGVVAMIDALMATPYTLALATGKSRKGLEHVLRQVGWLDRFAATRCADETQSKPHPQMLNELLAWSGVAASQALMIGDTVFDLEMAHRAGMQAWAVTWGAHALPTLERLRPERIFTTVAQLHTALLEQQ